METRSAKTVPLSLHSFFREGKHLQLLRARLKESRAHLSVTQRTFVKLFALVLRTLFQQNVLLFTPAARGGHAAGDALKTFIFFSQAFFAERQREGGLGGNVRASFLLPFLCDEAKKWHPNPHSAALSSTESRWAVRASGYEVVEDLAVPPPLPSPTQKPRSAESRGPRTVYSTFSIYSFCSSDKASMRTFMLTSLRVCFMLKMKKVKLFSKKWEDFRFFDVLYNRGYRN